MGSKKLNKRCKTRESAYLYFLHNDKGSSIRKMVKIYQDLSVATMLRYKAKPVDYLSGFGKT